MNNIEIQLVELNAAIADLVESTDTKAVSKTLGEILAVMKAKDSTVTVRAPVTVNVPPPETCNFKVDHVYDRDGRLTTSHITRVPSKPE